MKDLHLLFFASLPGAHRFGSNPVIENSAPNFRKGSEAEIHRPSRERSFLARFGPPREHEQLG